MISKPTAMLWELISRLASANLTIRISGEPGVGKEAIARLLYSHYPQKNGRFCIYDCRLVARSTRGQTIGNPATDTFERLEAQMAIPQNCVFYLSHIDALPANLQSGLHHMIRRTYPTGSPWVLVSSTEPLEHFRDRHQFSHQLFNDLDTIHICLPSLRTRPDRIPQILSWLLGRTASNANPNPISMPDIQSMQRLVDYHWPGNWCQIQRLVRQALDSQSWIATIDAIEAFENIHDCWIDTMAAIYILSSAKFKIQKERVMESLMEASSIEEVGLLDMAIYNEALGQIADHLCPLEDDDDDDQPEN